MDNTGKWILFITLICGIIIFMTAVYGLAARFIHIPELRAKVNAYQSFIITQEGQIKKLKTENDQLHLAVRWDKFLKIMLDKDERIRFDGLEEYLKQRGGLYVDPKKVKTDAEPGS